jgi:hypothetical protein
MLTDPGEEAALMRHAVAALLSASHPDVDYQFSAGEAIALFQLAYATGDYVSAKNLLEQANDEVCPL